MGFPSIKTEEVLAATYRVGLQTRNSSSVLGVQPDGMGEVLKKWVEVSRSLHGSHVWPHMGSARG